jgi:hypothetical protein
MKGFLMNGHLAFLSKEIKFAIRKEIRKECRQEAIKILELGDDKDREDFLKYHQENKGNICCMVLDFAKKKLLDAGKWKYNTNDCFKNPYTWLDDEK